MTSTEGHSMQSLLIKTDSVQRNVVSYDTPITVGDTACSLIRALLD